MEHSVKKNADAIIFNTAKCAAGVTFSFYRKAESDIRLAIPPAYMPAEWRL